MRTFALIAFNLVQWPWLIAFYAKRFYVPGTWRHGFWSRISSELRPFFLPVEIFYRAVIWNDSGLAMHCWYVVTIVIDYWLWRIDSDDDDVWRKRGRKLKNKLTASLPSVLPAPSGA